MTNEELLAALEAATGPSRELDAAIQCALDLPPRHFGAGGRCNAFTLSVDAALLLVPDDWRIWRMAQPDRCGEWKACAISDCDYVEGQHVELPIALCIAALRARSAQP